MSVDWQWQEMTWHRTITPAAAGAGLERLATAVELGSGREIGRASCRERV